MNFILKIEGLVYPRYSILEIFKMLELVKEALGKLGGLTRDCKYHL